MIFPEPIFPEPIVGTIVECAHWADRIIRAELIEGLIAGENDYTSNFIGALRREINSRAVPNLTAKVFVLKPGAEQKVGADACIILASSNQFKVCVFESKWPRLNSHSNYWDSVQKSPKHSHFHDQLCRQAGMSGTVAIWEMFYCEYPYRKQPKFFPDMGSACVWHGPAHSATMARPDPSVPWTDLELEALLKANALSISDVMQEVCECRQGEIFQGSDYLRPFLDYGIPSHSLIVSYNGANERETYS